MSYFDMELGDGSTVQVRKLRTVKPRASRRATTRSYAGRKSVYGDVIPVVRRRRERKCILSWVDGIRPNAEASFLKRTYVPADPKMDKYEQLFLNMGWTVK